MAEQEVYFNEGISRRAVLKVLAGLTITMGSISCSASASPAAPVTPAPLCSRWELWFTPTKATPITQPRSPGRPMANVSPPGHEIKPCKSGMPPQAILSTHSKATPIW